MLQRHHQGQRQNALRKRHPMLTALVLLGGAVLFSSISPFADTLFPLLILAGISPLFLCLSLACVLGIAGVLAGIIGILERIDRRQIAAFSEYKEQSYAHRN